MQDQVISLDNLDIDARMLTGTTSAAETTATLNALVDPASSLKLLYVEP